MEELQIKTGPFEGTPEELDKSIEKSLGTQQEEFVRTGWLLRSAEDTGKYRKLGYKSMGEYAKARFNLTKDVASKYININKKYSEGGYSEYLAEKYKGYGVGKLGDMLTLSDEIVDSLSPELTRKEIQEIKREIKEEEKITDIEVMMEQTPAERPEFDTLAEETLYQYLKENREEFKKIFAVMEAGGKYEEITEKLLDIIAPSGVAAKTTRIPGKGKIMISIKGRDEKVDFLNVRTNEKESQDWSMVADCLDKIMNFTDYGINAELTYEELYGEPFNVPEEKALEEIRENTKVAPVQPIEETEKQPEVEKVTGEVVEQNGELEEIKEKLAVEFIKYYETRLEYSENMRDEVHAILDRVHKYQWIFEHKGVEYFVVEVAGYIKLRQGEEIITELQWEDFYELMHKVYWQENHIPQQTEEQNKDESCTGATEEQIPGQMEVEDYPELLPEGTESNYDKWLKKKPEVETRVQAIKKAIITDDYAAVEWEVRRLAELMEV